MPVFHVIGVKHFRFRNDDGSETTATWIAAKDTGATVPIGTTIFRLRLQLETEATSSLVTDTFNLQCKYNSGSPFTVGSSSSNVRGAVSTNVADGGSTTNQLGLDAGDSFTSVAGQVNNLNALSSSVTLASSHEGELEWTLVLVSGIFVGDTLDFTLLGNGTEVVNQFSGNVRLTIGAGPLTLSETEVLPLIDSSVLHIDKVVSSESLGLADIDVLKDNHLILNELLGLTETRIFDELKHLSDPIVFIDDFVRAETETFTESLTLSDTKETMLPGDKHPIPFHNVVLNESISLGMIGGPNTNTTIMITNDGIEKRNINWCIPIRRWNIGYTIDNPSTLKYLITFFTARAGAAHSFLFKDWSDYQVFNSTDGYIGVGDSSTTVFQLIRTYSDSAATIVRLITKPKQGTVKIYVDGVAKVEGNDYTINYLTGLVTFTVPVPNTFVIYWTGNFYYRVRFDIDDPQIQLDGPTFGKWDNIPIVEVREGQVEFTRAPIS